MASLFTIKDWAQDDRPREKLLLKGEGALSDTELIAVLLGSGTKEKNAVQLAQEILSSSSNDLLKFSALTFQELISFKGIGSAKAITLLAALELGKRRKNREGPIPRKITCSEDIYNYLFPSFENLKHEEFFIVLLNRANEIIHKCQISKGGLSQTTVDGKIVFKIALQYSASAIILAHNHPSGNLKPSTEDCLLTEKLVEFGKMIDLIILDHLIFTDNGYLSFADKGIIIST